MPPTAELVKIFLPPTERFVAESTSPEKVPSRPGENGQLWQVAVIDFLKPPAISFFRASTSGLLRE